MNILDITLKKQGRSKKWLANEIGVSMPTMLGYCKDVRVAPFGTVIKIAGILGVTVNDLLK